MDVTTVKVPCLMEGIILCWVERLTSLYRDIRMIQMLEEIHTNKRMKKGLL
jgi:hypothetical protein